MAKTVLKSLIAGPATRRYPFGPRRAFYKNTRGRVVNDIEKCVLCGLCQARCPSRAIAVSKEEKTWTADISRCVTCGCCVEVCPKKCLRMESDYSPPAATKERRVWRHA